MSWDRGKLAEKAIFYDEDIHSWAIPAAPLPQHVEALQQAMLDFSHPLLGYKDNGGGRGSFLLDLTNTQRQPNEIDAALEAPKRIRDQAKSYHQGGYSEKTWETFFKTQFFIPLAGSMLGSKEDSRRVSRCNYYYDAFRVDGDSLWNLFNGRADDSDTSDLSEFEKAKCPKPDYVFYLPMYNLDAGPRIPKVAAYSDTRQWHQAPNPSLVEPFSWPVLKELCSCGLQPTPFRIFNRQPVEANLKCYPWLIAEYKKEGVHRGDETVSCQAANAAACAISLNLNAARYAVELADNAQVPPIPTITTIGSRVKVWIMYFAKDFWAPSCEPQNIRVTGKKCKQGRVMKAVWEGDMTEIEDIIKFQLILENTHTWAMRVFRPLISSYINQWRHVHCNPAVDKDVANAGFLRQQQTIERCRTVTPMIQGLLDNHSGMEIDDSKHSKVTPLFMGLLVQQIFASERQAITEELDRILAEKIGATNLRSRTIAEETEQESTDLDAEVEDLNQDIKAMELEIKETHMETGETSPSWRSNATSNQSSRQSLDPVSDGDDSSDSDYQPPTKSPDSEQVSSPSLGPISDIDESNDDDDEEPQPTRGSRAASPSDAESELAVNPLSSFPRLPTPTGPNDRRAFLSELFDSPETSHSTFTPPPGTRLAEPSGSATPTSKKPTSRGLFESILDRTSSPISPKPSTPSRPQNIGTSSVNRTPNPSLFSAYVPDWPVGGFSDPQRPYSQPQAAATSSTNRPSNTSPRSSDGVRGLKSVRTTRGAQQAKKKSPQRPYQFNFNASMPLPGSQQNLSRLSQNMAAAFQSDADTGGRAEERELIDLTKDSQESQS